MSKFYRASVGAVSWGRVARVVALLLAFGVGAAAATAEAGETFKVATLAPEGSSWMKLVREWARDVEKKTSGRVAFKFFAGGSQGDEKDVVRKMRLGQLSGAVVTGVGLGLMAPDTRVLELPMLFQNYAELDAVRVKLDADFQAKFNEKGYTLVGWGEVGPVHLYTSIPVKSKDDLKKTRMWVWTDDPLTRAFMSQLGVQGVPLGVPDVLPSLQTGLIDACYGSHLSTITLQWHSRVKFITEKPQGLGVGAMVVSKKEFDKLSKEDQATLLSEGKSLQAKLLDVTRKNNERALNALKAQKLEVVPVSPAMLEDYRKASEAVAAEFTGKMYSAEWLAKVKAVIASVRK